MCEQGFDIINTLVLKELMKCSVLGILSRTVKGFIGDELLVNFSENGNHG